MRTRLKAAGVESASAPLMSTKVDPQTATTKIHQQVGAQLHLPWMMAVEFLRRPLA